MNGYVNKLYDVDSIVIPEKMLDVNVDEQRVEEELQALGLRYAKESQADSAKEGDLVYCTADTDSYPDGRTILIYTGVEMPAAKEAVAAVLGKKAGDTVRTVLAEKNIVLTVKKILRRIPVEVNDSLIESTGIDGVTTVEAYKEYIREKLMADAQMEASKMAVAFMVQQMTEESTYTYDEAEMEAYVQEHMDECLADYKEMGEEIPDPEIVRTGLIEQMKQMWMAEAFCKDKGIEVDMSSVEEQADQMIEMMELMGEEVPERSEMIENTIQDEYFSQFINYISTMIEQKIGGSNGNS